MCVVCLHGKLLTVVLLLLHLQLLLLRMAARVQSSDVIKVLTEFVEAVEQC